MKIRIVFCLMLLVVSSMPAFAFDSEKTHPDLTNETIEQYIRIYGTTTLSNGVDLNTKLSGEVVTKSGQVIRLALAVRDWIVIGSAEEDWGGERAYAHYYDPKASVKGQTEYADGAVEWIHDPSSQENHYVSADGMQDATGDFSYERFRYYYSNNMNDYRTYKMLGHLLHVLQDMASPPHVRDDSGGGRKTFEGLVSGLMGSDILSELLSGNPSPTRSGYLSDNADALGINSITSSNIPSKANVDDLFTELAVYVNENYFSPNTIYSTVYSKPAVPSVPPASPAYVDSIRNITGGKKNAGFINSANRFVFARSLLDSSTGWSGRVVYSTAAATDTYKETCLLAIKYGLGFINTATTANTAPKISIENISGAQSGNVEIKYNLKDAEYDRVNITMYYSEDGGTTYFAATVGPGGSGSEYVVTTADWTSYSIYWNSDADIGGTDQHDIRIKLVPSDSTTGVGQESAAFTLQNLDRPPSAVVTTPVDTSSRYITINYSLVDIDSSVASIQVYYSKDSGQTYRLATEYAIGSDGQTNLMTSTDGTAHVFVWDSLQDLGAYDYSTVRIKVLPSDASGEGKADETDDFSISNSDESISLIDFPVLNPVLYQDGFSAVYYDFAVRSRSVRHRWA